jgi:hypothetical protein
MFVNSAAAQCFRHIMQILILSILDKKSARNREPFEHVPFDHSRQIRLLKIKRKVPFLDLETEILCCDFDDAPKYDAISYVWGKPSKQDCEIILDGKLFKVSSRVHMILQRQSSSGSRYVWIDSICIDQKNNKAEKDAQIGKMRQIYQHAQHVYIHLVENSNDWLAVDCLLELLQMRKFGKKFLSAYVSEMMTRKVPNSWVTLRINALLDLLSNEWFTRVWVVQEFIAARIPLFFYGDHLIEWQHILEILEIMSDSENQQIHVLLRYYGEKAAQRFNYIPLMLAERMQKCRMLYLLGGRLHLHRTLLHFYFSMATEPKDKIIALIGITDATSSISQRLIDHRTSDYDRSIMLATCLRESGDILEVLGLAGLRSESNLPSWIIDWTKPPLRRPLSERGEIHPPYAASRLPKQDTFLGNNSRELKLHGTTVDRIFELSSASPCCDPDEVSLYSNPEVINEILKLLDEVEVLTTYLPDRYTPSESMDQSLTEAISRTLQGDCANGLRPAPDECKDYLSSTKRFHAAMKPKFPYDMGNFTEISQQHFGDRHQLSKDYAVILSAQHLLGDFPGPWSWRFCVTETGLIGMVPREAQKGDVICVMDGASVPFVLRQSTDSMRVPSTYQLVGESYIHGMMDGECSSLKIASQWFILV